MVGIADELSHHHVVGLDTSAFIYQFEGVAPHADVTTDLFRLIQTGPLSGVTSVITLTELVVKPLQLGRPETADDYVRLLLDFPNLFIVDIDLPVARRAATFRATYGLRSPDALQVAACLNAGATAFVTNDAKLRRVNDLQVIVLDDFTSGG